MITLIKQNISWQIFDFVLSCYCCHFEVAKHIRLIVLGDFSLFVKISHFLKVDRYRCFMFVTKLNILPLCQRKGKWWVARHWQRASKKQLRLATVLGGSAVPLRRRARGRPCPRRSIATPPPPLNQVSVFAGGLFSYQFSMSHIAPFCSAPYPFQIKRFIVEIALIKSQATLPIA